MRWSATAPVVDGDGPRFPEEYPALARGVRSALTVAARASAGVNSLRGRKVVVEDTQQPLGELRVGRDATLNLLHHEWCRAGRTHVVGEPVHLPGVPVAPRPPVVQRLVGGACAAECLLDRGRQLDGLPERVGDPLARGGVLEVAGVADQHPARDRPTRRKKPCQRDIIRIGPTRRAPAKDASSSGQWAKRRGVSSLAIAA